jgi:hypothetical protein
MVIKKILFDGKEEITFTDETSSKRPFPRIQIKFEEHKTRMLENFLIFIAYILRIESDMQNDRNP